MLCCLTTLLHGQQTVSIPVIVANGDQASSSIKVSDLKVQIEGRPVTVSSVTPLAGGHLQYVLLNDQSGKLLWPNGIKQQTEVADQFLNQGVVIRLTYEKLHPRLRDSRSPENYR